MAHYAVNLRCPVTLTVESGSKADGAVVEAGHVVINDGKITTDAAIAQGTISDVIGVTVDTHVASSKGVLTLAQGFGLACVKLHKGAWGEDLAFGTPLYAIASDALETASGDEYYVYCATHKVGGGAHLIGYVQQHVKGTKEACVRLAFVKGQHSIAPVPPSGTTASAFVDTPHPAAVLTDALRTLAAVSHNNHVECGQSQISAADSAPLLSAHAGVVVEGSAVHVAASSVAEAFFAEPSIRRKTTGKPEKVTSRIGGARIGKAKSPWTNTKLTAAHAMQYQDCVRDVLVGRKAVPPTYFAEQLKSIMA